MKALARIKTMLAGFLDDVCRIEREALVQGVMGEPLHQWGLVADDVACRLIRGMDGRTGQTATVGNQQKLTESYRVILPINTDVLGGDKITVGGVEYRVVALSIVTGLYIQAVVTT
jgi:hypothetical protein